ncbi:MAG: R3H domain-containing nucleic acid-binding protein [Dehalococcoidia bacterium]
MDNKLHKHNNIDEIKVFLDIFPKEITKNIFSDDNQDDLLEIILDLGRKPEARYINKTTPLNEKEVTRQQIVNVINKIGKFGDDNRAGIERTLHRISVIKNRQGDPVGITCRIGRAVFGSVKLIEDLIFSGKNILILGRPGVGKTTMLRETARTLSDKSNKRVVIVDTSNEIAGDGDVPHYAIGKSRRLQVPNTHLQHNVMIEAVENHMPEVIVIDEMSTELEALAARTIAERGVQLIATAHGNTLSNVISNPTLSDLIGGTQTVTLGDIEARKRKSQKTVLERKHHPTFEIVVEIKDRNIVVINSDVKAAVDSSLRGLLYGQETRKLDQNDEVEIIIENRDNYNSIFKPAPFQLNDFDYNNIQKKSKENFYVQDIKNEDELEKEISNSFNTRIYPFGISKSTLIEIAQKNRIPIQIVDFPENAEVFVTTKSHYSRRPTIIKNAEKIGISVNVLRKASREQMKQFLERFINRQVDQNEKTNDIRKMAIYEAELAISKIIDGDKKIKLHPQSSNIRKIQHDIISRSNLNSRSIGKEPNRRVIISKNKI